MIEDTQPHYARIIDRGSIDELKLALLRSIDHARKTSAEVAEMKAQLDGALGQIARLQAENDQLQGIISKMSSGSTPNRVR